MSSHNHMILLIRNLLDTPLHVYKPLEPHQIGINQFVILLFAHSYEPGLHPQLTSTAFIQHSLHQTLLLIAVASALETSLLTAVVSVSKT
jgi:hypothetical protein